MIARKYENSSHFVVATHHILVMSSSTDKISFIFTVMLRPVIKVIQRLNNVTIIMLLHRKNVNYSLYKRSLTLKVGVIDLQP